VTRLSGAGWAAGGGEMGARIRAHDWAQTPLGPIEAWPPTLRTAAELLLAARQPVYVAWRPDLTSLYNDGYIPILGAKHPGGLGTPYADLFAEIWDEYRPLTEAVLAGEAQYFVDRPAPLAGRGADRPLSYFTFSWTPLRDATGRVAGFYCAATETTETVRAEAALRASEEKYRTLFIAMDQGFCIIERVEAAAGRPSDFRYLTANPAFERHTGMRDVVGKTIRALVPDAEDSIMDVYDEVARTGQPRRFEAYVAALDLWMEAEAVPTQTSGQIAVLFSNVSDRKRAEAALRASEERQAFLLRLSDALRPLADPVAIQETATHILGAHLAVDRTYYVEIDDARQVAVVARDYVQGAAPSLVGEHPLTPFGSMLAVIRAGRTFVATDAETDPALQADRADYRAWSLRAFVSVPLVKDGALVAAMCVTGAAPRQWAEEEVALVAETAERTWAALERGRAEAALREAHATLERRVAERTAELAAVVEGLRVSEGRLRLLVEQAPVALWTTDRDLRLTALAGATAAALPPARSAAAVADLFAGGDADGQPVDAHRQALAGASVGFDVETEGRAYEAHIEPLRDAAGRVVGTIGVAHDVTDRTLLRLQDEFLALASHELRTPLTPTLGYLEMALTTLDGAAPSPARRYVARAVEQVGRLNALVGDLLDVGRLRGGKMNLTMDNIDLGAVVRRAVEVTEVEAGARGQRIALDALATPLMVRGDAGRLEQVMLNLLTNAVKYAPESPAIAVRLRRDAAAGQAVLEVQDAGQGIAMADLPHLFSRFYQVERPDRPSRGGLGLGLYLVQELVEAHQGTVTVASVVGQGTTFTVRLPLLPLPGARDIAAPWGAPAGLGGAKKKEDETIDNNTV